ncbi:MAG: hypothetical protein LBG64_02600, partial [Pseudomonadales bacterium]|nr:hypothetical protein [Pseudomonadales bacterium]
MNRKKLKIIIAVAIVIGITTGATVGIGLVLSRNSSERTAISDSAATNNVNYVGQTFSAHTIQYTLQGEGYDIIISDGEEVVPEGMFSNRE